MAQDPVHHIRVEAAVADVEFVVEDAEQYGASGAAAAAVVVGVVAEAEAEL
ncbi:hypothetical protein ACHAO9_012262 [Fusarium lateritium]